MVYDWKSLAVYTNGEGDIYIPTFPCGPGSPPATIFPEPYGITPGRFRKDAPRGFPESIAWIARYWRIDSGIESQSSPVSMLFFARSLILARLRCC